jgi:hypothetical protein
LLTQSLFKAFSLDLFKNSSTLPKAVIENQAIMENQCSFHRKSLVGEPDQVETIKEAAFSFTTFACVEIMLAFHA